MSVIVHLSDLHFGGRDPLQAAIHHGLVRSLEAISQRVDLLVLTGDVFDSASDTPLVDDFMELYARIDAALGSEVPALLLPGNHDRRGAGVFGPWSRGLFDELARRFLGHRHVQVLGTDAPFLARHLQLPQIPAEVIAYDSTYLPQGLISAGGLIRQEDLIDIAGRLIDTGSERPVLLLLHHHLVPTPVTDTSRIDITGRPAWQRMAVRGLLPMLVASGDREELTMTALGAGTALTTLHQMGRAVLVLHGHKHYPTARMLQGLTHQDADVLITSAGSCGTATTFSSADLAESPRLWPSFNLLTLDEGSVEVQTVAWSPWESGRRNAPRPLVRAERDRHRWLVQREHLAATPFDPVLELNSAHVRLAVSTRFLERHDHFVEREVQALPRAYMRTYWEVVEGATGAHIVEARSDEGPLDEARVPTRLRLPMHGRASYRVVGATTSTVGAAETAWGLGRAYEWAGLLNRSRSALARLSVDLGPVRTTPFASATDLTSGTERPLRALREGQLVRVEVRDCPARMLLRVYWPLEVA